MKQYFYEEAKRLENFKNQLKPQLLNRKPAFMFSYIVLAFVSLCY